MMRSIILIIVLLSSFGMGQYSKQVINEDPFANSGENTIKRITGIDTVYWRADVGKGVNPTSWNMFSNTITATEKTTESTQEYSLADESEWKWYQGIQFKIEQGDSVITSAWVNIGNTRGAITFAVKLDTSGTTTMYITRLGGN